MADIFRGPKIARPFYHISDIFCQFPPYIGSEDKKNRVYLHQNKIENERKKKSSHASEGEKRLSGVCCARGGS